MDCCIERLIWKRGKNEAEKTTNLFQVTLDGNVTIHSLAASDSDAVLLVGSAVFIICCINRAVYVNYHEHSLTTIFARSERNYRRRCITYFPKNSISSCKRGRLNRRSKSRLHQFEDLSHIFGPFNYFLQSLVRFDLTRTTLQVRCDFFATFPDSQLDSPPTALTIHVPPKIAQNPSTLIIEKVDKAT